MGYEIAINAIPKYRKGTVSPKEMLLAYEWARFEHYRDTDPWAINHEVSPANYSSLLDGTTRPDDEVIAFYRDYVDAEYEPNIDYWCSIGARLEPSLHESGGERLYDYIYILDENSIARMINYAEDYICENDLKHVFPTKATIVLEDGTTRLVDITSVYVEFENGNGRFVNADDSSLYATVGTDEDAFEDIRTYKSWLEALRVAAIATDKLVYVEYGW